MEQWNHRAHLTVAASLLQEADPPSVLGRLRTEIQRFNLGHGLYTTPEGGYHESLTRFWLAWIWQAMEQLGPECEIERLVDHCDDKNFVFEHYSRSTLFSWEARTRWVPPDLKELPVDPGEWEQETPPLFSLPAKES